MYSVLIVAYLSSISSYLSDPYSDYGLPYGSLTDYYCKLSNLEVIKKIIEMTHNPKETDVPYLYSQLGNQEPGSFIEDSLLNCTPKHCDYSTQSNQTTSDHICRLDFGSSLIQRKISDMALIALSRTVMFTKDLIYNDKWQNHLKWISRASKEETDQYMSFHSSDIQENRYLDRLKYIYTPPRKSPKRLFQSKCMHSIIIFILGQDLL